MKNFKKKILEKKELIHGMESRGFLLDRFSEKNEETCCFFKKGNKDLSFSINLHPWFGEEFQCFLGVKSLYVKKVFSEFDSFSNLNAMSLDDRPIGVLSISLPWIRCNKLAKCEEGDLEYKLPGEDGIFRFFDDIDCYGADFIRELDEPEFVADFLLNLKNYPVKIKHGGGPGSTEPYIYAAILYLQEGRKEKFLKALDLGWREYNVPNPLEYQTHVLAEFGKKRKIILDAAGVSEVPRPFSE